MWTITSMHCGDSNISKFQIKQMNNYRLKFMRKNERKMLLSLKIENTTSKDSFTHQFENGCESKTE